MVLLEEILQNGRHYRVIHVDIYHKDDLFNDLLGPLCFKFKNHVHIQYDILYIPQQTHFHAAQQFLIKGCLILDADRQYFT